MLIITYDISDDKERTKLQKLLEGYGNHLQDSVFSFMLSERKEAELRKRLNRLNLNSGFAIIWDVPDSCQAESVGEVPGYIAEFLTPAYIV